MSKLSVIIPIYRVEATLDRCVESVVSQTGADLDIILVDDGSPDRCPQRCDEWAAKDNSIRVIHKSNGGLSDARNAGIEAAQGDYITFVDSDDYLAPHTYAPLMARLAADAHIDLLEYPVCVAYGSPRQHTIDFADEQTYSNMTDYWYETEAYQHSYACNKIYRAALFSDIRYPVGIVFEDMHTLPLLLQKAKTVATSHRGLYYYCANADGITATADGQALRLLLEPHVRLITESKRSDRPFQTYYMHVLNIQMDVYELTGDAPILPQRPINPRCFKGTAKLKAIALRALKVKRLCKLNKLIHKIWRNH